MNPKRAGCRIALDAAMVCAMAAMTGCIERTVTITTVPPGATVHLNDQEVGKSPVTVPFTWYGDYDVICRKPGYRAVQTHVRVNAPWYETPGLDLFAECFTPFTIRDHHAYEFQLEAQALPTGDELKQRAAEFKEQALFQGD